MRGADLSSTTTVPEEKETSPHAWSRRHTAPARPASRRNISTCVEQTHGMIILPIESKKHLHMRGADQHQGGREGSSRETSPHAWSRLQKIGRRFLRHRNISTCVEQTDLAFFLAAFLRKHLHMRGADIALNESRASWLETSPHAWSRQRHLVVQLFI